MVVDFSKLDLQEQPVLILKNTAGVPIGTLGSAMNITADIKYNESSFYCQYIFLFAVCITSGSSS